MRGMNTTIELYIALAMLISGAASSFANEKDFREQVSAEAARALAEENYAGLEAMSAEFLHSKARTPAGRWKLSLMYDGLVKNSNYASTDELFWSDKERRFKRWLERYPQSVAARIALGKALSGRAWQIRGRRFANETPQANWEPFKKQLAVARAYMEQVKPTASVDPEWYRAMMYIALGQGWDYNEVQALIDEMMSREPEYQAFYYVVVEYLTPKWYGSNAMIDQFAAWLADRTQAKQGQAMYATIYWYVGDDHYGVRLFREMNIDWKRMRAGFDEIVARYPDAWNINKYARFACLAKDYETAASLMKRIDQPLADVWGNGKVLKPCLEKIDRLPRPQRRQDESRPT